MNEWLKVFKNTEKSLVLQEQSELHKFTSRVDKSCLKMPKMVDFGEFLKPEACSWTVLPDRSLLLGQKLVENAKN